MPLTRSQHSGAPCPRRASPSSTSHRSYPRTPRHRSRRTHPARGARSGSSFLRVSFLSRTYLQSCRTCCSWLGSGLRWLPRHRTHPPTRLAAVSPRGADVGRDGGATRIPSAQTQCRARHSAAAYAATFPAGVTETTLRWRRRLHRRHRECKAIHSTRCRPTI